MIQRDYILRMIEEFRRVVEVIMAYRSEGRWQEVMGTVDEQFRRLVGVSAQVAIHLSETDLTAPLMRGEATQVVRDKLLFLIRLFKEAGDAAVAQDRLEEGHNFLLRGLEFRVGTYWGEEPSERADFAPPVEAFTGALAGTTIPPRTQAMLMHHYERTGAFAQAEDTLYALLEAAPGNLEVVDWGSAVSERSLLASRMRWRWRMARGVWPAPVGPCNVEWLTWNGAASTSRWSGRPVGMLPVGHRTAFGLGIEVTTTMPSSATTNLVLEPACGFVKIIPCQSKSENRPRKS